MKTFLVLQLAVFCLFSDALFAGVFYVKPDAMGKGDSWDHAASLDTALSKAEAGDEIWVARGVYRPTVQVDIADPRTACFQMKNGVGVFGGFRGIERSREERNWEKNITVLSGDIGIPGTNADNCYHVLYHPAGFGLDTSAVLDGFTISGGNASAGTEPHGYGGGMCNYDSSPTVRHCVLRDNKASSQGGGMYNYGQDHGPVVLDCTFVNNRASYGGGLVNTQFCTTYVYGSTFQDNYASG